MPSTILPLLDVQRNIREFRTLQWSEPELKELWSGRLHDMLKVFETLEENRPVFIRSVEPANLAEYAEKFFPRIVVPLEMVAFDSTTLIKKPEKDKPFKFKVAVCPPEKQMEVVTAYKSKDDIKLGQILDYPECCIDFFCKHWGKAYDLDLLALERTKSFNPNISTMLRHIGVRLIPHLPCSFDCKESFQQLKEMILTTELDPKALMWVQDFLTFPFKYSANHGAVEYETKLFKLSHDTDWTPRTIKYDSEKGFDSHVRNDFKSEDTMNASHEILLDIIGDGPYTHAIDFGAGDGTLLSKVNAVQKTAVEKNPNIQNRNGHQRFYCDLKDYVFGTDEVDLAMISLKRFAEMDFTTRITFMNKLFIHCRNILVYVYSPWKDNIDSVMLQLLLSENWQVVKNNYEKGETSAVLLNRVSIV